jgi:hypothetical protein
VGTKHKNQKSISKKKSIFEEMDDLEVADEEEADNKKLINQVSRYKIQDKPDFTRKHIEPLPELIVMLHEL